MTSKISHLVREWLLQQKQAAQSGPAPSIEQQRKNLEAMSGRIPLDADVTVTKTSVGGIPGEWVVASNALDNQILFYLHGGAYYMGSCKSHRDLAARISRAAASRVLVIEYRLAPEHPFPAAIEDSTAAYRGLLNSGVKPSQIAIAGDSAGGGLAVATLVSLRDAGDPLPATGVLLSPWTDLEGTGASMTTREEFDPWLDPAGIREAAKVYLNGTDPRHPLASPIYADLHRLPPMLVHVGHDECLLDDSIRLVNRAQAAGVDIGLTIWEDMWHVFQSFAAQVPEGRKAIEEIGKYIQEQLAW